MRFFFGKKFYFLLLFLFLGALYSGELRIAATSDLHGDLRKFSALAFQIRRGAPDLLLDAGDLTGGNLLAELDGGRSMIAALNLLKYDCIVPGNHDFDLPQKDLAARCRAFKGTVLGADWRWGDISGVPHKIVTRGKFRVGIIGLTEPGISRRHLPLGEGLSFADWKKVLQTQIKALQREKVHFIILLWHNGIQGGKFSASELEKEIRGVDLVIGGHTHQAHPGARFGKVYMVQPGPYASSAALVTVHYDDETLEVKKVESTLLRGTPKERAADIDALNKRAVKPYYPVIYSKVCRRGDLSVRNFPKLGAEALRLAGKSQGAIFSALRPEGKSANFCQYRDLFRLMPFWSTLCTVTVTRKELKAILEDLHENSRKFKRIIGTAGFSWRPPSKNAPGKLGAPEKITITVNSYTMVSSPLLRRILHEKVPRWHHTGIAERDAVVSYLKKR